MITEKTPIEESFDRIPDETQFKVTTAKEKYWKFQDDQLIITWYYFPLGLNKRVDAWDINTIYYIDQTSQEGFLKVKGWGMSLTPIWWACDLKRQWHNDGKKYYNVVVKAGESSMYMGFTVQNITLFLNTIRPHLQSSTIISNSFPF